MVNVSIYLFIYFNASSKETLFNILQKKITFECSVKHNIYKMLD